ncbi:VWA domain-containing protein [Bradyrhizobium sp.]|uniref:nitric oxide reductase activation protein NorD n=1 Tax=Bradyrhizobium sp. TaxID=376 RepID=UPI0025C72236|nr:VWA domain-containing protein [Bradyrhizobium sp.]
MTNQTPFADLVESGLVGDPRNGSIWRALRQVFNAHQLADWRADLARLQASGLGPAGLEAYIRATGTLAEKRGPLAALALAPCILDVERHAGRAAAAALSEATAPALRHLGNERDFRDWLDAVAELAAQGPESVAPVLARSDGLLAELGAHGFRAWVLGGLRAGGGDPERRLALFSLSDPRAFDLFEQATGDIGFTDAERALKAYLIALFRQKPFIRAVAGTPGDTLQRRASFERQFVQVPARMRGVATSSVRKVYRAMLAHIGAHLVHSGPRFQVRGLKPMQVALVSLIEDARVEQLAMRELPGLFRLWAPFHTARADGGVTAPSLFARLSRALIDPNYRDDDLWVTKGRQMFFADREAWVDPGISRQIGNLLGNDLGQMRIQFNPRTYRVEPLYRDDNSGLWDTDDAPPQISDEQDVIVETVRIERTQDLDDHDLESSIPDDDVGQATARESRADDGVPVGKYAEYDYLLGRERSEWTTVVEYQPQPVDTTLLDRQVQSYGDVLNRLENLVGAARVSRPARLRARTEGDRLDLDATIEAAIDRRAGLAPSPRVYETTERRNRDLSVLVLLDISESTKDFVKGSSTTILTFERIATALLSQALSDLGDAFAVAAFCSNGRDDVRFYPVKGFNQPYDRDARARLAGLRGGLSTRIGGALRHAGVVVGAQRTHRRLVLVVTDGEPSDIDVADRRYFVEDARKAVQSLAHSAIDVFGIGPDGAGTGYLGRIFGRRNFVVIDQIARLPNKLPLLYMRLTS